VQEAAASARTAHRINRPSKCKQIYCTSKYKGRCILGSISRGQNSSLSISLSLNNLIKDVLINVIAIATTASPAAATSAATICRRLTITIITITQQVVRVPRFNAVPNKRIRSQIVSVPLTIPESGPETTRNFTADFGDHLA